MEDKKYSKLRAAFEATQPQVPADFTEGVMKRIEEQDSVPQSKHRRVWWAAAAACLLIIIGIGMMTLREEVPAPELVAVVPQEEAPASGGSGGSGDDSLTPSSKKDWVREPSPDPPRTHRKKLRTHQSLPDTLGNGIWQNRENVVRALQMLAECEATILREEQEVRNTVIEATFRATPQPANVILVTNEAGDYEVIETKNIVEI